MSARRTILVGTAVVLAGAGGLLPLAAAVGGGASRPAPVSIEVFGPDQTGFTPARPAVTAAANKLISGTTAHALSAAVAPSKGAPAAVSQPARVTGLSFLIDFLDTGSKIGLAELYGLGVSAFGSLVPTGDLPPDVVEQGYTVLAVPPELFAMFAQPTADGFNQLRDAIAPLAAGNTYANMLLQAMSDALIKVGTDGRSLVNPFDAQVVQAGRFLLVLQEDG